MTSSVTGVSKNTSDRQMSSRLVLVSYMVISAAQNLH